MLLFYAFKMSYCSKSDWKALVYIIHLIQKFRSLL